MKRFKYSLSNTKPLTCDLGQLIPIQCQEILPGDAIRAQSNALIRMQPMLAPLMHQVQVVIEHWYVPTRTLWPGWENFITGGPDGNNADTIPTSTLGTGGEVNGVADYMGVPPVEGLTYNNLPIKAYNAIVNENYRDQDLVAERTGTDNTIFNVAWGKDYQTTARPWEQKGDQITIPLGDRVPIATDAALNSNVGVISTTQNGDLKDLRTTVAPGSLELGATTVTDGNELYGDLSAAEQVPINTWRRAFAMQRYAENRARYGSRFIEYLKMFGVRSSDARLQRPERLGGGKSALQISEVLNTASDSAGTQLNALGYLGGHGITGVRTNRFTRFFEEHGYYITTMFIRPKSVYVDGMERMWLRKDREDFFQKELAFIGQQPVYDNEIRADPSNGTNVFGFSDRYREYREAKSNVAG